MTQPRRTQIDPRETPYVHCINRCVRRAFLVGDDPLTGRNFDHRRQWIVDKLMVLADVFAIDVCAFAVLSNHYHIVLHVDIGRVAEWDDDEVIRRWRMLFGGGAVVARYVAGECKTKAELDKVREIAAEWRERLADVSWFMRCLNEHIARQANREDECKGRFWEGRFKSQALLDETALLACMVYVDLNPIRAGMAATPEESDFTSIQARIRSHAEAAAKEAGAGGAMTEKCASVVVGADGVELTETQPVILLPFADAVGGEGDVPVVPFAFQDYLELVYWTGRAVRDDKRGFIAAEMPPILLRLGLDGDAWVESVQHYGRRFHGFVGSLKALRALGEKLGRRWLRGLQAGRALYAC